jgi:hypothetical protein
LRRARSCALRTRLSTAEPMGVGTSTQAPISTTRRAAPRSPAGGPSPGPGAWRCGGAPPPPRPRCACRRRWRSEPRAAPRRPGP